MLRYDKHTEKEHAHLKFIETIGKFITTLLILMVYAGGKFITRFLIVNPSTVVLIWVTYECIALICESFCFKLFIPWLNSKEDENIKTLYKKFKEDSIKKKET